MPVEQANGPGADFISDRARRRAGQGDRGSTSPPRARVPRAIRPMRSLH